MRRFYPLATEKAKDQPEGDRRLILAGGSSVRMMVFGLTRGGQDWCGVRLIRTLLSCYDVILSLKIRSHGLP
ncbi:hypothetical protein TorRG33x02_222340 [Trema orientale]|uniref:Uncharacterized protein n=1 Tax=Trema orientale TaxID=63057 RepID=A0A2P5E909_TREOI|nr:hypothetical protein TorRG33x02_222340 [Trema orientale]